MAITTKQYGAGMKALVTGAIVLPTDTLKATLHTSTYTPNQDVDDFFNDATNELSTASGYTAGGVTLTGGAVTYDTASQQVRFDVNDPAWSFTAGVTFRYMVVRKARGGAASADDLLCFMDWGSAQTVSGAYSVVIDPAGLLAWDVT